MQKNSMVLALVWLLVMPNGSYASTMHVRGSGCAAGSVPDVSCESFAAILQDNGNLSECEAYFRFRLSGKQWISDDPKVTCSLVQRVIDGSGDNVGFEMDAPYQTPNKNLAYPPRFYWFKYSKAGVEKFKVCSAVAGGGGYSAGPANLNTPFACADFNP